MSKGKFLRGSISKINFNESGDPFSWKTMMGLFEKQQATLKEHYLKDSQRKEDAIDAALELVDWAGDEFGSDTPAGESTTSTASPTSTQSSPTSPQKSDIVEDDNKVETKKTGIFDKIKERRRLKAIDSLNKQTQEARSSNQVTSTDMEFYDEDINISNTKLHDFDPWITKPKRPEVGISPDSVEFYDEKISITPTKAPEDFNDFIKPVKTDTTTTDIMDLEDDEFVQAFEKASNTGDVSNVSNIRASFNRLFRIKRRNLGPGEVFLWTNPKTGKEGSYSTDTADDVKKRESGSMWDVNSMKWIPRRSAEYGANYTTNGPEMLIVGDNPGGREKVIVEPLPAKGDNIGLEALDKWYSGYNEIESDDLASKGRFGDTEIRMIKGDVTHVNPWEAFLADNYGSQGEEWVAKAGSGSINPATGKKEAYTNMSAFTAAQEGISGITAAGSLGGTGAALGAGAAGSMAWLSNPWTIGITAALEVFKWIGGAKDEADYYDDKIVHLNKQKDYVTGKKGDIATSGIDVARTLQDLGSFEVNKLTNAYGNKLEDLGDKTRDNIKKTRGLNTGSVVEDQKEEEQDLLTQYNMEKEKIAFSQDQQMGQYGTKIRTNIDEIDMMIADIDNQLAYAHDHNETLENLF